MGKIYQYIGNYITGELDNSVFVEIGSDRYEGSTNHLACLAEKYNTLLHTIDVNNEAQTRVKHTNVVWHVDTGSNWTKNYNLINKISVLYLDNFDWVWNPNVIDSYQLKQIEDYKSRGIEMTNENSQAEHLAQAINLTPFFTDNVVIAIDDTYRVNSTFTGKGGTVVPYLLDIGFTIFKTHDYGIILGRKQ